MWKPQPFLRTYSEENTNNKGVLGHQFKNSLKTGDRKLIAAATVSSASIKKINSEPVFYPQNNHYQYPLFIKHQYDQSTRNIDLQQNSFLGNGTTNIFWETFSKTISFAYAIFIVTFGIVVYLDDLIFIGGTTNNGIPILEIYCVYLLIVGLVYFIFLYFDLKFYLDERYSSALNTYKEKENEIYSGTTSSSLFSKKNFRGIYTLPRVTLFWRSLAPLEHEQHIQNNTSFDQLNHKNIENEDDHFYCFREEHCTIKLYVKFGIAVFGMGHLLHSSLLLSYDIIFFLEDSDKYYKCASPANLILDLLYLLYSFLVMFFIFKYSNVIINRFKATARFALMHCIGGNLCFWLWTILRELMEAMNNQNSHEKQYIQSSAFRALPLPIYYDEFTGDNSSEENEILARFCRNETEFSKMFESFIPYLRPFTVEYSIITVAVFCKLWYHIGTCSDDTSCYFLQQASADNQNNIHKSDYDRIREKSFHSTTLIYYSSSKGLFAGFIVLVGCFLSIILFFVMLSAKGEYTVPVNAVSELIMLLLTTTVSLLAYRQIVKLHFKKRQILLDCVLLFISVPVLFVETILSISSLIVCDLWQLATFCTLLRLVQNLLQTTFIVDGLQRYSGNTKLRHQKPGKELILLLIVCNIAFWILNVFEINSKYNTTDLRSHLYGEVFWIIIQHLSMPLSLFYRFHSSVCLVAIWKRAYENK